jgi:hypothetical protein
MPNKIPDELMRCRVCGLAQETPPWGPGGHQPTFEICPCCGAEFGYDDATRAGVLRRRATWRDAGYAWFVPHERPAGWDVLKQLEQIPTDYLDNQA